MKTNLLTNTVLYSSVSLLQKGLMFFLLPLYAIYLSPSDYGVLSLILSYNSIVLILSILSLTAAAQRFHFDDTSSVFRKKLWGTIVAIVLLNSLLLFSLSIIFKDFLSTRIFKSVDFYPLILIGLLNTAVSSIYVIYQIYLQTEGKSKLFTYNALVNTLIQVSLIILFVVVLNMNVLGILMANLITSLIFFLYLIMIFVKKLTLRIDPQISKIAIKYSLPLIPHSLAGVSTSSIDKFFVNGILGTFQTGIYSVGQQFSSIMSILTSSINNAYAPHFYQIVNNENKINDRLKLISVFVVIFYSTLALLISIFAGDFINFFLNNSYEGSIVVIQFLVYAQVFNGIYYLFVNVLFLENTSKVLYITLITLLINIILNFAFIPLFGINGAALALLISYFCKSIIALFLSRWYNKRIIFPIKQIYAFVIISFLIAQIDEILRNHFVITDTNNIYILVKLILILIIVLTLGLKNKNKIKSYFEKEVRI